jgi:copper chaperone NosL
MVIAGVLLTVSIFVPIWRIDLDAPQYPEGLRLFIYSYKLGGNVDIINGLNHYIGMKTLHAEEFVEFTVLPYIIGLFAVASIVAGIAGRARLLYGVFALFVVFGVAAMVDFWRWEYDYGHNLDPNAAIIVPGMAYQPPLIGFKQLLNFGAYSIPSVGGWLFITSGALMLVSILFERNIFRKRSPSVSIASVGALILIIMSSCDDRKPEPIKLNTDNCEYCKMTISDPRFGVEIITPKGRAYKFDDLSCMLNYLQENQKSENSRLFVSDYCKPNQLTEAATAVYIRSEQLNSPMGGNTAAFSNNDSALTYSGKTGSGILKWNEIKTGN